MEVHDKSMSSSCKVNEVRREESPLLPISSHPEASNCLREGMVFEIEKRKRE